MWKAIVRLHLEHCVQTWQLNDPEMRYLSYESHLECSLTTLDTRRLRGDQIDVFKIVNGYEDVDRNMFFYLVKSC